MEGSSAVVIMQVRMLVSFSARQADNFACRTFLQFSVKPQEHLVHETINTQP